MDHAVAGWRTRFFLWFIRRLSYNPRPHTPLLRSMAMLMLDEVKARWDKLRTHVNDMRGYL